MILNAMNECLYKIVSSMLLQALHGLCRYSALKNNAIKLHRQSPLSGTSIGPHFNFAFEVEVQLRYPQTIYDSECHECALQNCHKHALFKLCTVISRYSALKNNAIKLQPSAESASGYY
jgi:hypothetical protein